MFGHDNNQDEHQGNVTLPTAGDGQAAPSADTSTTAVTSAPPVVDPVSPTPAVNPAGDTDLGSFLPSQTEPASTAGTPATDDLLDIKQEALQALSPLVGHLDQTPEEKFRTTMMMIQASDDHSLVKPAYEAAKAIVDEKERAQALLDIVNEINYFTQHAHAEGAEQ